MTDIKSGARSNGNSAAMKGVMVIVSDEEIKDIAVYVSKMKP
jgi:cytochrome c